MPNNDVFTVVAIGTWLYDGAVPRRIELLSKPATTAYSRWIEDQQSGEFLIDEATPVPETQDGLLYHVGATGGGEFLSVAEAIAWADKQPWGPVEWTFLHART
jgi:hypothetical protein